MTSLIVSTVPAEPPVGPYLLARLRFAYDALEPVIDAATLRLHHDTHHQAYVDAVNAALALHPEWLGMTIEAVMRQLPKLPADIRESVRVSGGGHANHQFFWKILAPQGLGGPSGQLAAAVDRDFGSFEAFKQRFEDAAARLVGPGWVFLVVRPTRGFTLEVLTLANNESVLTLAEPAPGLLICDLWDHAYEPRYAGGRADWLKAWWGIVNWDYVGERLAGVRAGKKQL